MEITVTNKEKVDIEIPFFAYIEELGNEEFIKIDDYYIERVFIQHGDLIEISKCPHDGEILYSYYRNRTNQRTFQEAKIEVLNKLNR